jgi:hypothetical protein
MKNLLAPVLVAVAALFAEQTWWVRGLFGAGLGAAFFIAIPAAIEWASQKSNVVNLRVDCQPDVLPVRLPAEGRMLVVELLSSPDIPPHQVGQTNQRFGEPGTLTGIPPRSYATRCEVRTVGQPHAVFDIDLILKVDFFEFVVSGDGRAGRMGQLARSGNMIMTVPRAQDNTAFVFWISNESRQFARIGEVNAVLPKNSSGKSPTVVVSHNFSHLNLEFPPKL